LFDSIGTSVFIMVGVLAALEVNGEWPIAFLSGMLTGIGGGILRDILFDRGALIQIPMKLVMAASTALLSTVLVLQGVEAIVIISLISLLYYLQLGWRRRVAVRSKRVLLMVRARESQFTSVDILL